MIVGIGNLVLDYYFFDNNIYINGGGTVSNILANLSNMGIKTKLLGYYGNDLIGKVSKEFLESSKVDTSLLEEKNYKTKRFFIDKDGYTSTCPYCNTKMRNHKLNKNIENISKEDIILIQDYVVLKDIPNKICLDFGYFKSLIYEDKEKIEKFIFRKYYIVSIKESALLFILKRLGITFDEFKEKCNIYFLIITKGSNGATIIFDNEEYNYTSKPIEEKETNGCGDVFFATFIKEIITRDNITKKDIDDMYLLALKNVSIVLDNIGARNHIVKNKIIKKNNRCICEDFDII